MTKEEFISISKEFGLEPKESLCLCAYYGPGPDDWHSIYDEQKQLAEVLYSYASLSTFKCKTPEVYRMRLQQRIKSYKEEVLRSKLFQISQDF
jgi:hypothetical protein